MYIESIFSNKLSIDLIKKLLYHKYMDMYAALADPTRRTILEMLAIQGQLSASDISDKFSMSPPAISQHLKVLRETKLVDMQKRGQQRLYQINPDGIDELEKWVKKMKQHWDERFDRLAILLEKEKQSTKSKKRKEV